MALTMTRTRTQTALTSLALMVTSIHGELAFLDGLIATHASATVSPAAIDSDTTTADAADISTDTGMPAVLTSLQRRRQVLVSNRDALYATIRQFDPEIVPERIGNSDEWKLSFGNRALGLAALTRRYLRVQVCS